MRTWYAALLLALATACGGDCVLMVSVVCAGEHLGSLACDTRESCHELGEAVVEHECPVPHPETYYSVGRAGDCMEED